MEGYLLDTNAASALWDARNPDRSKLAEFLSRDGESLVFVSVIVLAEVEYGLKVADHLDSNLKAAIRAELAKFTEILPIDKYTIEHYSDIRSKLFKAYGKKDTRGKIRTKRPEDLELIDRTTSRELGVQENDIWIVAQAIQYNLFLVTGDYMRRICEVVNAEGVVLRTGNWK